MEIQEDPNFKVHFKCDASALNPQNSSGQALCDVSASGESEIF